jgi:Spy/CpxP family protein refolding chaperone
MSDNQEESHKHRSRTRHGRLFALAIGAAILVAGAFGLQAVAQSDAYQHMRAAASFEGGWRHHDRKPLAEMTDAEIDARVTRMVRHLSIEIDATPEQEVQIISVVTGVAKELRPLKERMQATGLELQHLLTAETIDRAALESLRATRLAEAEQISKTLVGAVADVAEALTPEQRETVQAMIRAARERHGGAHHGGGWGRHRF